MWFVGRLSHDPKSQYSRIIVCGTHIKISMLENLFFICNLQHHYEWICAYKFYKLPWGKDLSTAPLWCAQIGTKTIPATSQWNGVYADDNELNERHDRRMRSSYVVLVWWCWTKRIYLQKNLPHVKCSYLYAIDTICAPKQVSAYLFVQLELSFIKFSKLLVMASFISTKSMFAVA